MKLLQEFLQNKKNEFIHFESLVSVNSTRVTSQFPKSQFPNSQSLSSKMLTLSNTPESDGEITDSQKSFVNSSLVENKPSDALGSNLKMNDVLFANNMSNSMIDGDDLDLAFKEASEFQINHEESTSEFKTTTN